MQRKLIFLILLLFSVCVVFAISLIIRAEKRTHFFGQLYANWILDNKEHFLSCSELPPAKKVEQVLKEHKQEVEKIKNIAPGYVRVSKGNGGNGCIDTADIIIYYASHSQRVQIENTIGADTFFGIPYRLKNI